MRLKLPVDYIATLKVLYNNNEVKWKIQYTAKPSDKTSPQALYFIILHVLLLLICMGGLLELGICNTGVHALNVCIMYHCKFNAIQYPISARQIIYYYY